MVKLAPMDRRPAPADAAAASRGGVRVIYFYHDDSMPLYLLLIYAKAERENWTRDEKQRAHALTESIKQTYRRH